MADTGFWNHITSCKVQALRIMLLLARYRLLESYNFMADTGFWNHITSCKVQIFGIILLQARYRLLESYYPMQDIDLLWNSFHDLTYNTAVVKFIMVRVQLFLVPF